MAKALQGKVQPFLLRILENIGEEKVTGAWVAIAIGGRIRRGPTIHRWAKAAAANYQ